MPPETDLPYGTGSLDGWFTLRQAAEACDKSVETIRRWLREDGPAIAVRHVRGTKYVLAADLEAAAARRPAGTFDTEAGCALGGHAPTGPGQAWSSLNEAADAADRSKTTLMRWAEDDQVRSCRCRCGRRRYIWGPDVPEALARLA